LRLLLGSMEILPFDEEAAEHAARIRHHLEKAGKKIGPLDTLIAGTALAHRAVLVTNNTREFSRIPELEIEDWLSQQRRPCNSGPAVLGIWANRGWCSGENGSLYRR